VLENTPSVEQFRTTCVVAGGGPAGMMVGFLLARAGIEVVVLEKHRDFLRDFRGDTIHPSTLNLMHELGLLDDFLKLPHQQVRQLSGVIGTTKVQLADFSHLPGHCQFLALMPQWDFLNFLAEAAGRYRNFSLRMETEALELIEEDGRIAGLWAKTPRHSVKITTDLIIAADGRGSTLRSQAALDVQDIGAPMDVLWMRLSRKPDDPATPLGHVGAGKIFVMLDRGDYWQCAFVIRKGGFNQVLARGLDTFRADIVAVAPELEDRVAELKTWDDIKLLTVKVDRLRQWARPGLICIGDAAHAMSPIGGVGINLAVQDAVAAANLLQKPLSIRQCTIDELAKVQRRRSFPTRATQWLQVRVQNNIISRVLASREAPKPPWPLRLIGRCPYLQRLFARVVGLGVRPEHVQTPDILPPPVTKRD
jgi:2-polyprenyl-6-methoxyphenol hydroxylase-like FAD-dependent oxidoreductase